MPYIVVLLIAFTLVLHKSSKLRMVSPHEKRVSGSQRTHSVSFLSRQYFTSIDFFYSSRVTALILSHATLGILLNIRTKLFRDLNSTEFLMFPAAPN
jgi:hypothetical protein